MIWDGILFIAVGLPFTVALTTVAFFIGAILGIPLLLGLRARWMSLRIASQIVVLIIRALPPIVWLFIIFFGIGSGIISMNPIMGSLVTFGMIATAYMAEIYRGALIAVDKGQWEAAQATGLGRWDAFRYVIAPQAFRVSVPSGASFYIALMKESAVASTIGYTGLTFFGNQLAQLTFQGLQTFAIVAAFYILFSLPIAWLSRVTHTKLQAKVSYG